MTTHLWQHAASFAARAHRGHTRRDRETPYIAHPFRVAMAVRQVFGCDDDVALAIALLHDTIEDTPCDYDDILEVFGEEVASGVAALTKDMRLPEAEREPAYDDGLRRASWRARLVKLGDVYDNLSEATDDKRRKAIEKCRRAVEIARPDASGQPATARAIEAVEGLVARVGGSA
jgi:guanosine-3',5'-bis(diphosphate) 3'-pyrophosphohydrolase